MQACRSDLFGKISEEKEVKQIAGNLMEARARRSYDMFHILAEFSTKKCLLDLLVPLKQVCICIELFNVHVHVTAIV